MKENQQFWAAVKKPPLAAEQEQLGSVVGSVVGSVGSEQSEQLTRYTVDWCAMQHSGQCGRFGQCVGHCQWAVWRVLWAVWCRDRKVFWAVWSGQFFGQCGGECGEGKVSSSSPVWTVDTALGLRCPYRPDSDAPRFHNWHLGTLASLGPTVFCAEIGPERMKKYCLVTLGRSQKRTSPHPSPLLKMGQGMRGVIADDSDDDGDNDGHGDYDDI